jgi:hypothetical protein
MVSARGHGTLARRQRQIVLSAYLSGEATAANMRMSAAQPEMACLLREAASNRANVVKVVQRATKLRGKCAHRNYARIKFHQCRKRLLRR